jgi:hypothetical protein
MGRAGKLNIAISYEPFFFTTIWWDPGVSETVEGVFSNEMRHFEVHVAVYEGRDLKPRRS